MCQSILSHQHYVEGTQGFYLKCHLESTSAKHYSTDFNIRWDHTQTVDRKKKTAYKKILHTVAGCFKNISIKVNGVAIKQLKWITNWSGRQIAKFRRGSFY